MSKKILCYNLKKRIIHVSVGKVQQRQIESDHSDRCVENRLDALVGEADILNTSSFKDFSDIKSVSLFPRFCEGGALRNRHKYFGH